MKIEDREYREVVIDITQLKAKQIKKLMDLCEELKTECYVQDEKGNTTPFLRKDVEAIFGSYIN